MTSTTFELDPIASKHLQALKFSSATRRLPLLCFLGFMGIAVLIAGALAHDRANWQAFWNKEAVLNRGRTLNQIPLALFFDSLATSINRIFVKGGWIVAGVIIILVQTFYICLVMIKRDRVPSLQFIRHFKLNWMIAIETGVLLASTLFFLICTWSFNQIARTIGSCTFSDGNFSFPAQRDSCPSTAVFKGFDISGHCFLIVHSCLLVLEYASKILFVWRSKEQSSDSSVFNDKDSDLESIREIEEDKPKFNDIFNRNYTIFRSSLVIVLILVFLLCFSEFLVFLQTILFYHTVLEKLLGTFIGTFFWLILFFLSLKYPHLF